MKPILDEIDGVLGRHYGFTGEELDFIPSTQGRPFDETQGRQPTSSTGWGGKKKAPRNLWDDR